MIIFNDREDYSGFSTRHIHIERANKILNEVGLQLEYNLVGNYLNKDTKQEQVHSLTVELLKE
tara:strand:+ start:788 stop:976 length:189 start_codon:yes stop_codon:yes gene_type:complete